MSKNLNELLVVDVESTCWEPPESRPPGEVAEITEIGYCLLNLRTWEVSAGQSLYVLPEHSEPGEFCKRLTGIDREYLVANGARPYLAAVAELNLRMPKLRYLTWASWGDYDREMFRQMAALHESELAVADRYETTERRKAEHFTAWSRRLYPWGRTHLNAKALEALLAGRGKELGQAAALAAYGLEFEGRPHRGADDAVNAARVIRAMLRRVRGLPEWVTAAPPHPNP